MKEKSFRTNSVIFNICIVEKTRLSSIESQPKKVVFIVVVIIFVVVVVCCNCFGVDVVVIDNDDDKLGLSWAKLSSS